MENLKNNTKIINISILVIVLIVIFIIYMLKDYLNEEKDSIKLSNKLFKKYKGKKDCIYKYKDDVNIGSYEKEDNNIMREDFFIKKKKKITNK